MSKYLLNNYWVFDTGNNLDITTTLSEGFYVDIEHPLKAHGPVIAARFSEAVCFFSSETLSLLHLPRLAGVTTAR